MGAELFWLLSFCGFAAMALVCGLLAWPQLSAAWPSIEERIDRFRRQPPLAKVVLLVFIVGFIAYGSTKTTQVDQTSGTNGVEIVEGGTNEIVRLFGLFDCSIEEVRPSVTPEDIARGWQLWEVRTNHDVCYTMPEGATMATNWWMRGAYEDVVRVPSFEFRVPSFCFPYGSNEWDSAWVFTWGKLRFALADTNTEIVAVGAPMSAVPYRSRLWSAADTNGSRLVTWENFALNRDTDTPVNAQIELRRSGDFITRSNEVEAVYRRLDQEDWDDDGWRNDDDPDPYVWEEYWDSFWQELPEGANSNVYYWVDIRPRWNSYIEFFGDGPSDLDDPCIWAKAGETYRVQLLIGKMYDVESDRPFDIVAKSDARIEVSNVEPNSCTVVWPVTLTVAEGRAPTGRPRLGATWNDGGSTFHVLPDPPWLNGRIVWDSYCCALQGDGTNFTFACDGNCTCEGCTASGNYIYAGYALPFWSWPCGCGHIDDQGDPGVAIDFDKSAIIYEDAYTNNPGEVVHPVRSNAVLRCSVAGGTYGGTLSVTLNGTAQQKLRKVWGDELPNNLAIAPGAVRFFVTEYEILEPSGSVGDIQAAAIFHEDFRDVVHSNDTSMTSIRLRLEAIYDAPENHNPSRHIYGVGELVNFAVEPSSSEILLVTKKYDTTDDSGYGYELFGGRESVSVPYADWYRCPVSASNKPPIRVVYEGCEYWPTLTIVEPSEIVTTGAAWGQNGVDIQMYDGDPKCWPYGAVGAATLVTTNYVGPMHVSFMGIAMTEVPCEIEDTITGCFATNHIKTHTTQAGAGELHMIRDGNFFFVDGAKSGASEANWQPNSRLNWKIPIGWHRIRSDYAEGKQLYGPDYEYNGAIQSRKLLIGGRIDKYMQNRYIDDSGSYRTDKFGHWISRSRWCRVVLDGTTLQWWHLW